MPDLIELDDEQKLTPTGLPPGMQQGDLEGIDENTVSPEEQAQYDQFVTKALTLIHGEKSQDAILEQLNQKDLELYEAVGRSAAQMAMALADQAKAAGIELSPDVVWHATKDYIVPELFEIGEASRIFPEAPQEQIDMAFLEATKVYGEQMLEGPDGGKLSEEAENFYAEQVAREVDSGEVDPDSFRGDVLGVQKGDPMAAAVAAEMSKMGGRRG